MTRLLLGCGLLFLATTCLAVDNPTPTPVVDWATVAAKRSEIEEGLRQRMEQRQQVAATLNDLDVQIERYRGALAVLDMLGQKPAEE